VRFLPSYNFICNIKRLLPLLKKGVVMFLFIAGFLVIANNVSAQAIVETFEEPAWTSAALNYNVTSISTGAGGSIGVTSFGTTTVPVTAPSAAISHIRVAMLQTIFCSIKQYQKEPIV
jgi:hypothetical protein